jgi:hypothetical protein
MPFDRLMVLSKVEGLTALSKAEGRRCASSFVIATYDKYDSFLTIRAPPWAGFRLAQLAYGAFYCAVHLMTFYESIKNSEASVQESVDLEFGIAPKHYRSRNLYVLEASLSRRWIRSTIPGE